MTENLACIASSSHVLPLQTGLPYTGPTPSDSEPLLSPALLCFQSFNMAGTYSFLSLSTVCVCVCGCLTDSHLCAPTLSPSRSHSLSLSVVFSLKLTHTIYRSISYCLSRTRTLSLPPSLSHSLYFSLSLSHSLPRAICTRKQ